MDLSDLSCEGLLSVGFLSSWMDSRVENSGPKLELLEIFKVLAWALEFSSQKFSISTSTCYAQIGIHLWYVAEMLNLHSWWYRDLWDFVYRFVWCRIHCWSSKFSSPFISFPGENPHTPVIVTDESSLENICQRDTSVKFGPHIEETLLEILDIVLATRSWTPRYRSPWLGPWY